MNEKDISGSRNFWDTAKPFFLDKVKYKEVPSQKMKI